MSPESLRAVHYKDDLRKLTRLIAVALTFFGAVLIAVVAYSGASANRAAVLRERQQVENALDNGVSRVLDEQKSIAWWDDAVTHIALGHVDTAWADIEVGAFLNETYGHDEIFVVNAQNEPVYAYVNGARTAAAPAFARHRAVLDLIVQQARHDSGEHLTPRGRAFEAGQGNYRELLGATHAAWSAHVLSVEGHPAVVSAITIVPNVTAKLQHGTPYLLLSIVSIDSDFMNHIGSGLLLKDLALTDHPRAAPALVREAFVADDQSPLGSLTWTTKQPGRPMLIFILPLVIFGVVGAGALTAEMLRRLKRASAVLAARESQARHQSLHDSLCGLPNRRHFIQSLQDKLDALVQARGNGRVVVAYIDVDRFKDVNDTLGHQAGDTLIMAVAARLQSAIGPSDFIARFGGDEFAVLRWSAGPNDAADLAERLQKAFGESFDIYSQHVRMTASIGISMAPEHGCTPQELMRHADIALYEGKNQGRDRAMMFNADMAKQVEQRREIELDLQQAMNNNELQLYYQPLVAATTHKIKGLEALLRWRHPVKGDISPAVFVPVAEEAGLMPALGAWVLDRAFADSARWPNLELAINLSPVQFRHVDLVELLEQLVAKHNVDPHRIVLEVTEGVMLDSTARNRQILEAIRAMGFKVALDDFGTGYSSLRYLADFRFDKIKIDRAFVTDVQERKRALTIIQSVVTLGRGLGMDIVAEGVETETEATVMRMVGATELQGFFFSQAVPADQVAGIEATFAGADMRLQEPPRVEAIRAQRLP